MSQPIYAYEGRTGVLPVSWSLFHGISKALAAAVSSYQPEIIVAIGRGGYYPGTLLAHLLRVELYPARLSRRVRDVPTYERPRWLVRPPELVRDQRVLLVDEICDSGETLQIVKDEVEKLGAREVRSAVMYAHTRSADVPDYIGLISDDLILNPWDREIYRDGGFQFHPEYVYALEKQGLTPSPDMLVDAEPVTLAKGATESSISR